MHVPVLEGSEAIADVLRVLAQYDASAAAEPGDPALLIQCKDGLWYAGHRSEIDRLLGGAPPSEDAGAR